MDDEPVTVTCGWMMPPVTAFPWAMPAFGEPVWPDQVDRGLPFGPEAYATGSTLQLVACLGIRAAGNGDLLLPPKNLGEVTDKIFKMFLQVEGLENYILWVVDQPIAD
ncbi:hypothetical protein TURU_003008 [Turdus rufiventris]|nr:hypothetical protein TURU_003008 [Turdus rufiventris]